MHNIDIYIYIDNNNINDNDNDLLGHELSRKNEKERERGVEADLEGEIDKAIE